MSATSHTITASRASAEPLPEDKSEEALAFLAERPLHTVIMAGLLREHGLSVPAPRGRFYGCRQRHSGLLEGVALIGRATLFEAHTHDALIAFAELARESPSVHMIMGEEAELNQFLGHYDRDGQKPRCFRQELFYQFTRSDTATEGSQGLRQATLEHLDKVVSAHAEMVAEETGLNPLDVDPAGFRERCAARVARGKVWTLIEQGKLIFKADVITETPEAAYVEGVWVSPQHRHEGYGRRCWTQLSRALLQRLPSFCGFVNVENAVAHAFYERMGGTLLGTYRKVYL
ncbi:MAG TPA: GNAT family N-acetyltransferase [Pyrinomonadaceae bacterium]|nr:GNAT family N-acetyltransferase [Pyrinomonadaceae bacterium]